MKEISEIINAFYTAKNAGVKTALATVVKVEGSSYRQPGARMLVTEKGELTGAISGGCLEGDALRRALLCISQKQNKLITYDTSKEEDADFGMQLGCNGIVHILFEYIDENKSNNPIVLLEKLKEKREVGVIASLYTFKRNAVQTGTSLFYRDDTMFFCSEYGSELIHIAKTVLQNGVSLIKKIDINGQQYEALIEFIDLPLHLVIAGAGNDVQPLVKAADLVGWETTVADGRFGYAQSQRFPEAKNVWHAKPGELIDRLKIDSATYFILMTHNYKYDLALLELLLKTCSPYIGILGPKSKLNRMFDDLHQQGIEITDNHLSRIYGPVGLDIGAETSHEISISVLSEIMAVRNGKSGRSLKYKTQKIHDSAILLQ